MGKTTKIAWTGSTWNPWEGCTKVSPGCDHCYAETLMRRWGRDFSQVRRASPATFNAPLHWLEPGQVFTCSMSDYFHQRAALWREEAWAIMKQTPWLTYQVLTKRPGWAVAWYKQHGWLPNVWLGVSVENQKYAPRLDVLARVPAPVRFVSCEPLLGPLDLRPWLHRRAAQWLIIGGESGPGHRPMQIDWAEDLRMECRETDVLCFVKQDSGLYQGKQGRFSDELWACKEMPT